MISFASAIKPCLQRLRAVSNAIYQNPEVGLEEHSACRIQMDFLRESGFAVTAPSKRLKTAFKAVAGRGRPTVCFCSEYDALPELGHACGHNLIAVTALAAGLAVKAILAAEKLPGQVVIMGTPAEEMHGGKIYLQQDGAFDGVDCCLMAHPFDVSGNDPGNLAVYRFDVKFTGKPAHAACEPEAGINALDAVNLLFAGIGAWRQQLPGDARIHGIITDGGIAPNIIPEHTSAFFYIRSSDNDSCMKLVARFKDIVKGAALMTGCKYKISSPTFAYSANKSNPALNRLMAETMLAAGLEIGTITRKVSTDFADISLCYPACSVFFDICSSGQPLPLHTVEFRQAAGTEYAFQQALLAAQAMTAAALRYFQDAQLRRAVSRDFGGA